MPNEIFVSPADATSKVVRVAGTCYIQSGTYSESPTVTTANIQEHKADCKSCTEEQFYQLLRW